MTENEKSRTMVPSPGEQCCGEPEKSVDSGMKKSDPKPKKKKKKVTESDAVPCFNQKGICCKCKSSNIREESISCSICEELFHAVCRDQRGNIMSNSISTKTALDQIRPIIAKYGSSSNRWGNFMFICNRCSLSIKSKSLPKPKNLSEFGCQTEADNVSEFSCQTETVSMSEKSCQIENEIDTTPKEANNPLIKDIGSLLSEMKSEILKEVNNLMESKLRASSSDSPEPTDDILPLEDVTYASKVLLSANKKGDCISSRQNHPSSCSTASYNTSSYSTAALPNSLLGSELKDHIVILSTTSQNLEAGHMEKITKVIDDEFKNIPFTFVKSSPSNKKIILSFPSEKDANIGKQILQTCDTLDNNLYTIADAKKMYPKITVSNIPNYLVSHIVSKKDQKNPTEYREELKTFLLAKILEKNEFIKDQLVCGKIFEIVFVNVGKEYTTLGIKVSPILRDHLVTGNRLYVGNTRCPVFDRFHVKQCFKCQKIGHISTDCREDHVICMYCSATHSTGTCPSKTIKSLHKCRNCAQSKDPSIKDSCDTHHSGSSECPTIIREKKRLEERTDYSKNL